MLVCVTLYILNAPSNEAFQEQSKNIELVVARYKENLDWLKIYDDGTFRKIIIYNKSDRPVNYTSQNAEVIIKKINNVGVCDHTYLYHIVENYYRLADITVFIPGSGTLEHKKQLIDFTVDTVKKTNKSVIPVYSFDTTLGEAMYNFTLDKYKVESAENREDNIHHAPANIRPFGKWYETYFPNSQVKKGTFTGIFAVSRDDIQKRDIQSYKELLAQVSKDKLSETSHYIERAWTAILHGVNDDSLYESPVHMQRVGVINSGYNYLRRK